MYIGGVDISEEHQIYYVPLPKRRLTCLPVVMGVVLWG
jgi:hypothetical protein